MCWTLGPSLKDSLVCFLLQSSYIWLGEPIQLYLSWSGRCYEHHLYWATIITLPCQGIFLHHLSSGWSVHWFPEHVWWSPYRPGYVHDCILGSSIVWIGCLSPEFDELPEHQRIGCPPMWASWYYSDRFPFQLVYLLTCWTEMSHQVKIKKSSEIIMSSEIKQ